MIISIDSTADKFTEHLKQPDNNRIFFSGKFGTGKSYFLKKYFDERPKDYNVFWLSPVNYVVGANQDIFEWIKVDIAKQLIALDLFSKKSENYSDNLILQTYVYQHASELFSKLMVTVGDALIKAKTNVGILGAFVSNYKEYKKFKDNVREIGRSDEKKMLSFLDESFQIKGSIFEDDFTTQIIRASIEYLKLKSKKETVLVIDDLDRLDPEHIFRILNILSAHNDHFDTNKFGFEKVLLVCDLENIENIYKHRYGEKVDFDGYVEKFYSYQPFLFSIKDAVVDYCEDNIFTLDNIDDHTKKSVAYLLTILCSYDLLKTRNLKKILSSDKLFDALVFKSYRYKYRINEDANFSKQILNSNSVLIDFNEFDILKGIVLLGIAFGGLEKLQSAMISIREKTHYNIDSDNLNSILQSVATLSHIIKSEHSNELFVKTDRLNNGTFAQQCPVTSFLSLSCSLQLCWNEFNVYKIDCGHYFANTEVQINSGSENGSPKINMLLNECISVIKFIIDKQMFHNIKQSSYSRYIQ